MMETMTVHMHWAVRGIIDAGGDMQDVRHAARRVMESVTLVAARVPDAPQGLSLYASRMACEMLSEAPKALRRGEPWAGTEGPIHVRLRPVR